MIWLVQLATMLISGAVIAMIALLGAVPYGIAAWAGMSAVGFVSAYRATWRGLLNYAAWIAPPAGMALANWLCWGYLPEPGPVLVCALVSLVGAAAGEVMNQRERGN